MDLDFTSVVRTPTATVSLLAIVVSAIVFLALARRARNTAALLPLTLPPLVIAAFATWIDYANLLRAMSLASRVDVSPVGIRDAFAMLLLGALVTLACTAIASFLAWRRPDDAIAPQPRGPIVVACLVWLLDAAAIAMGAFFPRHTSFTAWNVTLLLAFVSLALLVAIAIAAMLGHRRVVARGAQVKTLGVALLIALTFALAIGRQWIVGDRSANENGGPSGRRSIESR